MKRILNFSSFKHTKYLVVLFVLLVGVGNTWAGGDDFYAKITITTYPTLGAGLVYACGDSPTDEPGYTENTYTAQNYVGTKGSEGGSATFFAYAKNKRGYVFDHWDNAGAESTDMPLEFTRVVSDTKDAAGAIEYNNLVAYFAVNPPISDGVTYEESTNGTYKVDYDLLEETENPVVPASNFITYNTDVVTLTATPADGYAFKGWTVGNQIVSYKNPWITTFDAAAVVKATFTTERADFLVDQAAFENFNTALDAANAVANTQPVLAIMKDYALPAGDYTINAGVSLLIPYSDTHVKMQDENRDDYWEGKDDILTVEEGLSPFRTLTLSEGVNINCHGTICVAGHIMSGGEANAKSGYPAGACGMIDMTNGGHIELNDGATLYAWGIIKGQDRDQGNNTVGVGTIIANSGATVWEDFQVGDFRGGTACLNLYDGSDTYRFFPFQSYNICNIEVPVTFKYGSLEKCYTNLYALSSTNQAVFALIGSEETLFLLSDDNSLLRKWYDPTTDLMCYEMSGTTQLDAIRISFMSKVFNSANFLLPISSNMKIIMTNTDLTLSKPIVVHAGAELEIKKDAHVTIDSEVYLFDNDQWDKWVKNTYYRNLAGLSAHKYRGDGSDKSLLDDAKIIVNGSLTVSKNGKIYTSASGAQIVGNGGGQVTFASLLQETIIKMFKSTSIKAEAVDTVPMTPANLYNDDGSYTRYGMEKTFHNVNGRWFEDGKENEKADHTYDFTYMAGENLGEVNENLNTGDDVETLAVYSTDKTSLEAGYKWANVTRDGECTDNYNAADGIIYNFTKNNAWTQFIPDDRELGYSGSDNKLYTKDGCGFTDPVAIDDETCLYPFPDGNKALVNGTFIALTPNAYDAAYKDSEGNYYICFKGCNWHEATPYDGEQKTYNVVKGGTYIWYNSEWVRVERGEEDPFFYTTNEQNVKTYYEYVDGEWIIALPNVTVTYGDVTRDFYSLADAFAVASSKKNTVVTLQRDFKNVVGPFTYAGASTTCTFDLNGHTAEIEVEGSGAAEIKMFTVNAEGTIFTITDNSASQQGELKLIASINTTSASKRWTGIYLANGTLVMERGKVYVENHFPHTSTSNTGIVSGVQIAGVGSERNFTMTGGHLEASARYSVCGVHGLEGNGAVITINGGTIDATAITGSTVYGILAYGTINVNGGTVNATSEKSTTVYGIYVNGSYNKDKSPKYYAGTCNLKGGTVNATAKTNTTAYGVYVTTSTSSSVYGKFYMEGGTLNVKATQKAYGIFVNRANSYNSSEPRSITAQYPAFVDISGGEINVTTTSSNIAEGVSTYGTANISGGTFTINAKTSDAFGVRLFSGTTTISGSAYFDVQTPTKAYGVRISEETPSVGGAVYNGTLVNNGGTFNVHTTTGTTAYGVFVGSGSRAQSQANDPNNSTYKNYYKGNYANAGTATINDGVFDVTAGTNTAYALFVRDTIKQAGVTDKAVAVAVPKCTVNGGKFKVSGSSALYAVNNAAKADNFKVYGGYFNRTTSNASGTTLSTYIVSPKKAIVLTNAAGNCPDENYPEYTHKVAEAYLITFMNGETQLQSTLQNAGVASVYNGLEPRKDDDGDNSYEFDGWATEAEGDVVVAKGAYLPNVSAAATYYAHFATTAKKYIITWNANGGTCATELTRVEATGSATVGTLPEATKAGYKYEGWFTEADGGTAVTAKTVVTGHVTYYAHYTVHSHTLTWDANGGAIAGTAHTSGLVNYGASITAPANNKVTRTGYTFAGWDATPATTMPDNDLTYTAQWTPATNTAYKVIHEQQRITLDGYDEVETENLTGTTGAYVTPETKSYEGYRTPAKKTVQILSDGSLKVEYLYDYITYTIAFDAATNGGTCDQDPVTIIYDGTLGLDVMPEATKEGNDFMGWFSKPVGGDAITTATTFKYNVGAIYAQFRAKPELVIGDNESTDVKEINVSNNSTVETTTVHTNGSLNIASGRTLTTTNLILESDAKNEVSGEIEGNVVATNAYFDLKLNTPRRHWRAFSVPFEIDLKQHPILADGVSMPLGVQYDIVYYDGAERAAHGKTPNCWRYVEDDANWILTPGKAYMIVFGRDVNTVRFTKRDGASVKYTGTVSVSENHSDRTGGADGGWNGIGNPATYHAMLNAGVTDCQVHNGEEIGSDGYTACDMGKFIVGKAVFVQVGASQSVVVNRATVSDELIKPQAPRRTNANASGKNRFDVQIAPENGKMADRMFLLADEDKEDKYVILQDLAKAGLSTKRAQIWVDRYGTKLCKNTAVLTDGQAEYPLGIFAPVAGDYTIQVAERPDEETTLYLTFDGQAIWNLTYGDYVASLEKGTTSRYGLRLVRNTPQVATGMDEAVVDANGETRKVLINDQVFIIRGEKVYTIDGQLVK